VTNTVILSRTRSSSVGRRWCKRNVVFKLNLEDLRRETEDWIHLTQEWNNCEFLTAL